MMKRFLFICCLSLCFVFAEAKNTEPLPIIFWHSMSGELGKVLNELVENYNHSQSKYQIKPIYKGGYTETLVNAVAAFRSHQQPAIVQVYDIGTATLLTPKGAIIPFHQLMTDANIKANWKIIPVIQGYYEDDAGRLSAMPFNVSTPVLYYNKTLFKKAGINISEPPRTWKAVYQLGKLLLEKKQYCALTSTWPTWVHMENFSVWHDVPFASENNGFRSTHPILLFNQSTLEEHLTMLQQWQQLGIFYYGGREDNAMALFTSGKCAMSTMSSGGVMALKKQVDFDLGVSPLPYHDDMEGAPQNTLLGGAALWTFSGFDQETYRGVADFYRYLLQVKQQLFWQEHSGYIVTTTNAFYQAQQNGFYRKHPEIKVAIDSLMNKPYTQQSKGIRLGNYVICRILMDEALEQILSGKRSVESALDWAVLQGNQAIDSFAKNVKGGK